eukprot:3376659-Pleurochrysis_carterae.AAC.1
MSNKANVVQRNGFALQRFFSLYAYNCQSRTIFNYLDPSLTANNVKGTEQEDDARERQSRLEGPDVTNFLAWITAQCNDVLIKMMQWPSRTLSTFTSTALEGNHQKDQQ